MLEKIKTSILIWLLKWFATNVNPETKWQLQTPLGIVYVTITFNPKDSPAIYRKR